MAHPRRAVAALPWGAALWLLACGTSAPAPRPAATGAAPTVAAARPTVASAPTPAAAAAPEPEPAPEPPTIRGEVVLVALGAFPIEQIDAVEAHLRRHAAVDVRRLDPIPLPRAAYTAKRRRYRADRLLDFLVEQLPEADRVDMARATRVPTTRILGLTAVDISTTKPPFDDWGIFGLGAMPGQAAVVSTFRLRRRARDGAHVIDRLNNTALHEVGHTFGLEHCTEERCPMQDAEGSIANTDAADDAFGPGCAAKIERDLPIALRPRVPAPEP